MLGKTVLDAQKLAIQKKNLTWSPPTFSLLY
jgi:hypothetical protein